MKMHIAHIQIQISGDLQSWIDPPSNLRCMEDFQPIKLLRLNKYWPARPFSLPQAELWIQFKFFSGATKAKGNRRQHHQDGAQQNQGAERKQGAGQERGSLVLE